MKSSSKSADPLKIVIRRLPALIPEHILWASVDAHLDSSAYDWRVFVPGKASKATVRPSRAYIHFAKLEALVSFSTAYNGHLYQGSEGQLSQAVVEFAPYQRIPQPRKTDPRQASIEQEPEYVAFLAKLQDPQFDWTVVEPEISPIKGSSAQTPLVQHLQNQRTHKTSKKNPALHSAAKPPNPNSASLQTFAAKPLHKGKSSSKTALKSPKPAQPTSSAQSASKSLSKSDASFNNIVPTEKPSSTMSTSKQTTVERKRVDTRNRLFGAALGGTGRKASSSKQVSSKDGQKDQMAH